MTPEQNVSPLISVIMPVYNREEFLSDAVESIHRQSYKNFELILADDGSTDGSSALIREYARRDHRIRPVFFPHRGKPKTFNAAASLSIGKLIAHMDSDDIALPDRLAAQLRWMEQTNVDICGSQVRVFGSKAQGFSGKSQICRLPESHGAITREMLFQIALWGGTILMRADVFRENPFNEKLDFTDCEWPQRMALKCTMGNVPQILVKVRRHGGNITDVKKDAFRLELGKSRFRYFYSLFPHTPLPDYLAFSRVVDCVPITSLWEFKRAGRWLVEFAQYPDRNLRQRMAERWRKTFERSGGLGKECEIIYLHYKAQMEDDVGEESYST